MRIKLALCLFIFCVSFFDHLSCLAPGEETKERAGAREYHRKFALENLKIEEIVYIKDERTSVCFAYYWGGTHEGPVLATVPCEKVEKLLIPASSTLNIPNPSSSGPVPE